MEGDRKPIPFLKTGLNDYSGSPSPVADKQERLWMAYHSDEMGSGGVYLRPFLPGARAGAVVRVSADGGSCRSGAKMAGNCSMAAAGG